MCREAREKLALEQAARQQTEDERARAALQLGGLQQQYDAALHEVQSLLERLAAQDAKVALATCLEPVAGSTPSHVRTSAAVCTSCNRRHAHSECPSAGVHVVRFGIRACCAAHATAGECRAQLQMQRPCSGSRQLAPGCWPTHRWHPSGRP
jgi:hypothetical protein